MPSRVPRAGIARREDADLPSVLITSVRPATRPRHAVLQHCHWDGSRTPNRCRCPSAHLLCRMASVSCNVSVDSRVPRLPDTHVCLATLLRLRTWSTTPLATLAAVAHEYQHDYNARTRHSLFQRAAVCVFALGLTTETVNSALQRPAQAPLTLGFRTTGFCV